MKRKQNAMTRAGLALLLSSSMTMNALASSVTTTTGVADVETTAGKNEAVKVTITVEKTENSNGSTTVHTSSNAEPNQVTESGMKVDYSSESTMTTNQSGVTTGNSNSSYTVVNGDGTYSAEGGSETTITTNPNVNQTVDVPLTSVDDPKTEEKENQNTVLGDNEVGTSNTTGDKKESETDGEYNYTTETVVGQGSVTITTEEVTFDEIVTPGSTNMEHVNSETTPNDTNDLTYADVAPDQYLPGYSGKVEGPDNIVDGYEYVYVGSGNTSKLVPAIVFNTPLSDEDKVAQYGSDWKSGAYIHKDYHVNSFVGWLNEEYRNTVAKTPTGEYVTDEEGFILDIYGKRVLKEEQVTTGPNGETLYLHRFDNASADGLKVEGWYEDGEWKVALNGNDKYTAVWAGPQQFILVDSKGNTITTYCADNATPTQDFFGYNVENLEDADYYSEAEAAQIRSIVRSGYWGTVGTETDENGNEIPKSGSLAAMKADLLATGDFTEEELKSLNDGVALTATQMAIWSCSNKMSGIEFINAHYSNWGVGDVPKDKEDEVKLLFKIYDYLTNLAPTELENTTQDTVVNADNFVDDLAVTVVKKAENHENNNDDDDTNDAYVTNISFALVVQPSTENGDDLIVQVIAGNGKVLAQGKVAGAPEDGIPMLEKDSSGNYSFTNIEMVEGEQNFKITMEGIQNLKEGVYLYSSEVRAEDGEDTSSQTLVGIAEGQRTVDVSMSIKFELDVEDEVIATEHVWREEETKPTEPQDPPTEPQNPPTEPQNPPTEPNRPEEPDHYERIDDDDVPLAPTPMVAIEEDPVPLSDVAVLGATYIEDSMVPLAVLPATGDHSLLWMFMSFLSGLSLAGASLVDKMKRRKK